MGVGANVAKNKPDYATDEGDGVADTSTKQKLCRITVNLTERSREALEEIADRRSYSKTDTINRALQMYAFIERIIANGDQLLVKSSDGRTQLIKFV